MASPAQALANAQNAQHSTGPRTVAGKAKVAGNGIIHGLFTAYERLAPEAADRVNELIARLRAAIPRHCDDQYDVVREYALAIWRNEIFRKMETSFFEAAVAVETERPESVALVETYGENILWGRALVHDAEGPNVLTKLMRYETRIKKELKSADEAYRNLVETAQISSLLEETIAPNKANPIAVPKPAPEASHPQQTPRNAPCPCGSGEKFKRCCGENAPAVLGTAS